MWAKLNELKPGDELIADGGFDCLEDGERCLVLDEGGLCVRCKQGLHFLEGQLDFYDDSNDDLIGFRRAQPWP